LVTQFPEELRYCSLKIPVTDRTARHARYRLPTGNV
jgi:hypothetical protein